MLQNTNGPVSEFLFLFCKIVFCVRVVGVDFLNSDIVLVIKNCQLFGLWLFA